jgi:hypothetical protein
MRRLVVVASAFLVASVLISGFNAYATFAAPQQSSTLSVPTKVGFEGLLLDDQVPPEPVDGEKDLTFRLYTVATSGSQIWCQTQTDVDVDDGLYSVQLDFGTNACGSDTGADLFTGDRWLAVKVGTDNELTPRIPVSAVPFALNAIQAEQALGLQGRDVADTAPTDGQVLTWDSTSPGEWGPEDPSDVMFSELIADGSNAVPNDFMSGYRQRATLDYVDSDTVRVSAGEIMVDGQMRRNTSSVDVEFTADPGGNGPNLGLDTGSAQAETTYYVHAVADDSESTFDLIISTSDTDPTGPTHHRLIGSFGTDASTNIAYTLNLRSDGESLGNDGGLVKIAEINVASAVSSVSFTNIPSTYRTLVVRGTVRPTSDIVHLRMRFNSDTGSNYTWSNVGHSTVVKAGYAKDVTYIDMANGGTANTQLRNLTNHGAALWLEIPNYAETDFYKVAQYRVGGTVYASSTTYAGGTSGVGRWDDQDAIDEIEFHFSSGNVDAGSLLTLYGIPG